MASVITIIGLIVNLIGTILLLKAGLGGSYDAAMKAINLTISDPRYFKTGLGVLIAGFAIQILGAIASIAR